MIKGISLSDSAKHAVQIAQSYAKEYIHEKFSSSHLLLALLHKEVGLRSFIESMGKDYFYIKDWAEVRLEEMPKSGKTSDSPEGDDSIILIFEEADNIRLKLGLDEINHICILAALIKPNIGFSIDKLKTFPIKEKEIFDLYVNDVSVQNAISGGGKSIESGHSKVSTTALLKFCLNKTEMAKESKLDLVIGRETQIRMIIEILGRRTKPNIMITGESGVGKSSLVNGLAQQIFENKVPESLMNAEIFEIDLGAILAGSSYKGELEDRIGNILKELKSKDKSILFIDDIHQILDTKGPFGSGIVNILKPELAKGNLTLIGISNSDDYRRVIESDQTFNRFFEQIKLEEPNLNIATRMVELTIDKYEKHHELSVENDAIGEAVRLSKRYLKEKRLPDSAIDLLDRSMAAIKLLGNTTLRTIEDIKFEFETIKSNSETLDKLTDIRWFNQTIKNRLSPILVGQIENKENIEELETEEQLLNYTQDIINQIDILAAIKKDAVNKNDIAAVIAYKTGIPLGKIQAKEQERLLNIEDHLKRRVIGQDHALKSISEAILESRSGLNKPGQPIGSFFMLGPTGTGKTEVAKSIADFLFNDEKSMIRFDMSEFKEEHSAALLYGAPPGYVGYEEGGMLVNKIREKPYAVVLFDEIEKAHPSVFDIFLQILDEGHMHDRLGKEGDFSNALILFTSNIGSEGIIEKFNNGEIPKSSEMMEVMAKYFRPEFLARLTEIVPFAPISESSVVRILEIQMKSLTDSLNKQGMFLEVSDDAKKHLALLGFTPKYGARPINGVIRNYLRRPISKLIISNKVTKGNTINVGLDNENNLTWNII
jgi:ATP-dependent Clp protease ATP-binding subunit ClpB